MEDHEIPDRPLGEWQPITDKGDLAHLGKLSEEAAKLCAAISRCIIQGIDEAEPVTGKINREWLEDEIADVLAMIDHNVNHFGLDLDRIEKRRERKFGWKDTWFKSFRKAAS